MKIEKIKEKIELDDQFDVCTEACWNDCLTIRGNSEGNFKRLTNYLGYAPIDLEGPRLFQAIKMAQETRLGLCFGYRNASTNPYW